MRATHAINNIYKLISFLNWYLLFFKTKLLSNQDFMMMIHSNFLSALHGFRHNDVLLPTVIVSPPQGTLHTRFHDGFWKSDYDFQLMIHSNVLATIHGFRDNKVVLPTGYDVIFSPPPVVALHDVIVISPHGGTSGNFFKTDSERASMTSWYCRPMYPQLNNSMIRFK